MTHTHKLIEAKFPRKRGIKSREKREMMRWLVLKSLTHTHKLIEAKISMRARIEKTKKKELF